MYAINEHIIALLKSSSELRVLDNLKNSTDETFIKKVDLSSRPSEETINRLRQIALDITDKSQHVKDAVAAFISSLDSGKRMGFYRDELIFALNTKDEITLFTRNVCIFTHNTEIDKDLAVNGLVRTTPTIRGVTVLPGVCSYCSRLITGMGIKDACLRYLGTESLHPNQDIFFEVDPALPFETKDATSYGSLLLQAFHCIVSSSTSFLMITNGSIFVYEVLAYMLYQHRNTSAITKLTEQLPTAGTSAKEIMQRIVNVCSALQIPYGLVSTSFEPETSLELSGALQHRHVANVDPAGTILRTIATNDFLVLNGLKQRKRVNCPVSILNQ